MLRAAATVDPRVLEEPMGSAATNFVGSNGSEQAVEDAFWRAGFRLFAVWETKHGKGWLASVVSVNRAATVRFQCDGEAAPAEMALGTFHRMSCGRPCKRFTQLSA